VDALVLVDGVVVGLDVGEPDVSASVSVSALGPSSPQPTINPTRTTPPAACQLRKTMHAR
jgi:hypothetical protein